MTERAQMYIDPVTGDIIVVGGADPADQLENVEIIKALGAQAVAREATEATLLDPVQARAFIDRNTAWRASARAATVLAATTDLPPNLVRNIVQDLVNETQSQARQLNNLWRLALAGEHPELLDDTHGGTQGG